MRVTLNILCFWLAWLPLWATPTDKHGIEWMLTNQDCSPGDVVEIHARMARPEFSEFDVNLPKISGIHLVAERRGAVGYHKGVYTQEATWIIQPTRAGMIQLKGINASLKQGKKITEFELPALTLNVRSHATTEDSFTPEELPLDDTETKSQSAKMLWIGITAFVLLLLLIIFRPKSKFPTAIETPDTTLDDVRMAMEAGRLPTAMIEQILANPKVRLPPTLRKALEQAIYDRSVDHGTVLNLIREKATQ